MSINTTESKKVDPRSSPNPDSEYDTASDSHSEEEEEDDVDVDDEDDDLEDDEDDEIQEIDDSENDDDDGSIVLDLERQRGDGQETDAENKKKVDDDEDRSNPQYIPKKGTFYEHDDRTADDGSKPEPKTGEEVVEKEESPTPSTTKPTKKWQSSTGAERWSHDRFDAGEQAPKSRSELVSAYGYDIRNEDGPPRARRRRRYGRGPSKYTRKWEDEDAYGKTTPQQQQQQQQRKPRPEDFPALGTRSSGRRNPDESFKENNSDEINKRPQNRNYQQDGRSSPGRRSQPRDNHHHHQHNRDNRDNRENRDNRKDRGNSGYKTGRNTVEYKNQNRNKVMVSPSQYSGNNSNSNSRNVNNTVESKSQFEDAPMESMSFTNTKLFNNNNNNNHNNNNNNNRSNNERFTTENDATTTTTIHVEQPQQQQRYNNRNSRERDRPSNLSGRTQVPQRNQNQINTNKPQQQQQQHQQQQQQPLPPAQQQQPQQQPQIPPSTTTHNSNPTAIVESSRTKRYSSLRQKSTTDNLPQQQPLQQPQQQLPQQQHPQPQQQPSKQQNLQMAVVHDQVLLQQQEKNNLIQNNLIQDNLSYPTQKTQQQQQQQIVIATNQSGGNFQQIPIHLQNELLQTNAIQQQPQQATNQTIITTVPATQQTTVVGQQQQAQYPPGTYYASGSGPEFNPQQAAQQNPQPQPTAQMISSAQYPAQFTQPPTGTSYIQAPPGAYLPQQPSHPQPQIINYVPTIPATQTQYPAQFTGYQNYTAVPPTNQASAIYQTQSGLTFYAPQTQTQPRPILPQRRPTNAIPILAPPERSGKGRGRLINQFDDYEEPETKAINTSEAALGSAENIDHILDNMFVQRPVYQPPPAPVAHKSPPPVEQQTTVTNIETTAPVDDTVTKCEIVQQISTPTVVNEINDIEKSVKDLTIKEEIQQNPSKEIIIENSLSSSIVTEPAVTTTTTIITDEITTTANITEQPA